MLSHLAEVALEAGDLDQAEADLAQGFAFVDQSGERFWLADLHRLSGQLALRQAADRSRAEACFKKAIEVARGQQGRQPQRLIPGLTLRPDIVVRPGPAAFAAFC